MFSIGVNLNEENLTECFRPLSGIMFSIEVRWFALIDLTDGFPSPLGDYVFNLFKAENLEEAMNLFPSPLGDYVFNRANVIGILAGLIVSVPSRGLCFQSTIIIIK